MNKKLKTLISALLVIAMVFAAAGCAPPAAQEPDAATQPDGASSADDAVGAKPDPVTITIQMFSGPEAEAMQVCVDYWNENYADQTGITVNNISMSRVGYDEKMQAQLVSGASDPDIVHPFSLALGKYAPYLEPLNEYLENEMLMTSPNGELLDKDDMFDAAYGTVTTDDGNIYMIPKDMSEIMLYYRTDLIDTPPQTWEELAELAKQFTRSINPDSPTPYGVAVQGKYEMWTFTAALPLFWAYGADVFKPGGREPDFDNEAAVKTFKWYYDLGRAGVFPPGTDNAEYPEVLASLQNGDVAMGIQWNAAYFALTDPDESPLVYDKLDITVNPGVEQPDGSIERFVYTHTINLALNKNSKNKEAAFKFLAWSSFGEGAKLYAEAGGSSPVKAVWEAPDAPAPFPTLADAVGNYGRSLPIDPDISAIVMIGSSWVQKAIIGHSTPEECAAGLQKEIAEFLAARQ